MIAAPDFRHVADSGVLVGFGVEISDEASDLVSALDRALHAADIVGVVEVVPAFVNALVVFDPLVTDHAAIEAAVRTLLPLDPTQRAEARHHTVPVCYDASLAPDLEAVAAACGLGVDGVVEAHLVGDYRVAMYGFAPGYAYLAGVPEVIRVPRKSAPVRGVAAGSVIVAGAQCLVTTLEMPTGWSVIGRSPTEILRDEPHQPFLFDVGDHVSFERIDLATFERLARSEQR